ncbi:MAG: hypothetical protein GYB41_02490 [Oceanospirillales bacterium]|nr:hypothetical protein [Oceanospirillales bacterium]
MNTRRLISSLIAGSLVLGGSAAVFAGQKAGCETDHEQRMQQRLQRMSETLVLTPTQQEAVQALWQQGRPARQMQLGNGLKALDPNAANYQEQVQQHITQAQQQLAKRLQARADHKAALYAILTPEQEKTLEQTRELQAEPHGKHGKHGKHHRGTLPL